MYEVEINQLVPILTSLFFGWTISLKYTGKELDLPIRLLKVPKCEIFVCSDFHCGGGGQLVLKFKFLGFIKGREIP